MDDENGDGNIQVGICVVHLGSRSAATFAIGIVTHYTCFCFGKLMVGSDKSLICTFASPKQWLRMLSMARNIVFLDGLFS